MTLEEALDILKLDESASVAEIEAVYEERLPDFHPDLNDGDKKWVNDLTEARDIARRHAERRSGLILGPGPLTPRPQPTGSPAPEPPQPASRPTPPTATRPSRPAGNVGSALSDYKDEWSSAVGEFAEVMVYSYVEIVGSIFLVIAGFCLFVLFLKALL
jgi:hypothetical protein